MPQGANVTAMRTAAETGLSQLFERLKGSLPGDVAVRESALVGFAERGLPHRRIEEFKYTDLRTLIREAAPLAEKPGPADLAVSFNYGRALTDVPATRLTVVNGYVASQLNEVLAFPSGLAVRTLHDALTDRHPLLGMLGSVEGARGNPVYQLNTAFMTDGAVIHVAAGEAVAMPLHLRFVNTGSSPFATASRVLVVVDEGASVTILESHEGPDGIAYQPNGVLEIVTADRTHVRHVRVNAEGRDAVALSTLTVKIGAESSFHTLNMVTGSAVSRHQVFLAFAGENSTARADGATLLKGSQHADSTLLVDHAVPHCTSRELHKTVLDDESTGVFQGKIIVRPRAQKTDGGMKSDTLLLSDGASMNNKPELEIFADDVVCGHDGSSEMNAPFAPPLAAPYDVEALRAEFPILASRVYGKPLVYLDNAASAQKPREVMDAMIRVMETGYANVHRGLHYMANAATDSFEAARESVRAFLNAGSVDEIVFTKSATEAYNLVASTMGQGMIGEGDEIVLSIMEHHSNIIPWHFLRERKGAVIRWAPVDDDGAFQLDEFEKLLTPRTKIVAITHMSNVLGTVTPIADIIRISHAHGVPVLVDGAQGAVHLDVDVRELGADFYVLTGHKVYGPTGIGVLYGKRDWLERLPPYQGGGEMIKTVACGEVTYGDPPHRFEAGTPAIVEAVGLGAALRFMERVGRPAIRAHEEALSAYAHERLGAMNSVRIIGRAPGKGPILAFEMQGAHAHDVATVIDRQGVAVRAGTHCAMPLLDRFGATSTCRASFGLYNTMAEVDKLADALGKAEALFG